MQFHLFIRAETWTTSNQAIEAVLASFDAGALAPHEALVEQSRLPFAPDQIAAEIFQLRDRDTVSVTLRGKSAVYFLTFSSGNSLGLAVWGRLHKEFDATEVIQLISSVAEATRADYGFAGPNLDSQKEPLINNPFGPLEARAQYWLNLIGPGMPLPAWRGERRQLLYGGTLIIHDAD